VTVEDVNALPEGGLVRIQTADAASTMAVVEADGRFYPVSIGDRTYLDLPELLEAVGGDWDRIEIAAAALDATDLLAPVARPRKVICVGQNYADHVKEGGRETGPAYPDLFAKWDNALAGPRATLSLPPESEQVDFEAELAVVIGRRCRRVSAAEVPNVVFGYTAAMDGSVRDFQFHTGQRTAGKAWDGLTPIGPAISRASKLGGVNPDLAIAGVLNGKVMQDGRTSSLIFDVPRLISYISTFMTLDPGDLILTGTPAGVGMVRNPPVYLRDGDEFIVTIEGVGSLRNRFAREEV
jgi:acylpyruvate hydrolase